MDRQTFIESRVGLLPGLCRGGREVIELVRFPEATVGDLLQVLHQEEELARILLRLSNSAFLGLTTPVFDLREPALLLGFKGIQSLVLMAEVQRVHQAPGTRLRDLRLWEHAVGSAVAARMVASDKGLDLDDAFTAGLIHDIGKVILERNLGAGYAPVLEQVFEGGAQFHEAEGRLLGFDHAAVGALVAGRWGLSADVVEAVRDHHAPREAANGRALCATVRLASGICGSAGLYPGPNRVVDLSGLDATRRLGLTPDALDRITKSLDSWLRKDAGRLGLDLPE